MIQECPPRGESQPDGDVEEAGKSVREFARVLKEQVEDRAETTSSSEEDLVH